MALSFFSLSGAGLALAACNFTQAEFVERLVTHSRDSDPMISLAGLRQLSSHLQISMKLSGLVQRATVTQSSRKDSPDGPSETHRSLSVTSSISARLRAIKPPTPPADPLNHSPTPTP